MNKFFFSILAILLAGCAAPQLPLNAEKQIRNVAIISLVSEAASLSREGPGLSDYERIEIKMGDRINSTIEAVASRRLSVTRPDWTVKTTSYPRRALIEQLHSSRMAMAYDEERIEKELAELAQTNHLDALVVISSKTSAYGDGVGVVLRKSIFSSTLKGYVHSFLTMKIVGSDGKILAVSTGQGINSLEIDPTAYGIQDKLGDNISLESMNRLRQNITVLLASVIVDKFQRLSM